MTTDIAALEKILKDMESAANEAQAHIAETDDLLHDAQVNLLKAERYAEALKDNCVELEQLIEGMKEVL